MLRHSHGFGRNRIVFRTVLLLVAGNSMAFAGDGPKVNQKGGKFSAGDMLA